MTTAPEKPKSLADIGFSFSSPAQQNYAGCYNHVICRARPVSTCNCYHIQILRYNIMGIISLFCAPPVPRARVKNLNKPQHCPRLCLGNLTNDNWRVGSVRQVGGVGHWAQSTRSESQPSKISLRLGRCRARALPRAENARKNLEGRHGLERVEQGEENTIGGWLAYGHALNDARSMFPSNEQFGQWVSERGLSQVVTNDGTRDVDRNERAAAMWASANADQFEEARQRGNPRTNWQGRSTD